jgi:hypothetical protein
MGEATEVVAGAGSPFVVMVTGVVKVVPPVASTFALTDSDPSEPVSKVTPVTAKDPSAAAGTAVEESKLVATSMFAPQGDAAFKREMSDLARVPLTPRKGWTPA